jgi:mRNA interferase RelE/StbE
VTCPQPSDSREPDEPYERPPYEPVIARAPARALAESIPEGAAWAILDFIGGRLLENPHRIGHPLENELAGLYGAHVGDYRVIYRIDDEQCVVEVIRVARRADVYGYG